MNSNKHSNHNPDKDDSLDCYEESDNDATIVDIYGSDDIHDDDENDHHNNGNNASNSVTMNNKESSFRSAYHDHDIMNSKESINSSDNINNDYVEYDYVIEERDNNHIDITGACPDVINDQYDDDDVNTIIDPCDVRNGPNGESLKTQSVHKDTACINNNDDDVNVITSISSLPTMIDGEFVVF